MKTVTNAATTTLRRTEAKASGTVETAAGCRHHWVLGQPQAGRIDARCKICGQSRLYPAVLDDLDPGVDAESKTYPLGVATAAGGARPSSGALSGDESGLPVES